MASNADILKQLGSGRRGVPAVINTGGSTREVFTQPAGGPSVAGAMHGAADAWKGVSQLAGDLHDVAVEAGKGQFKSEGAQAVTRDPATGELNVTLRTPLNEFDEAYNAAASASFLSQSSGDRRLQLQKLAQDNIDDPEKFRVAAEAYIKSQAEKAPGEIRGDLLVLGTKDVGEFESDIATKKRARDVKSQFDVISTDIKSSWNDVWTLARKGGTETPEFAAALANARNKYGALRNPVFGVTDAQIEQEVRANLTAAEGEAVIGHAGRVAATQGTKAGLEYLNEAIWSDKINLSPQERESFQSRGRREIGEFDALDREARADMQEKVASTIDDALAAAENTGKYDAILPPSEIRAAYAKNPWKAADIIAKLDARASLFSMRKQVANASPAEIAAMDAQYKPGKQVGPQAGFDAFYSGYLRDIEGGYAANDGNGHPVNFGINQGANPDIDVSKLTPEQAKAVLKERYWDKSGANQLPPALAAVHGDTAINMGVDTAKDLLAKSGGDVGKYLDLREQRYRALASNGKADNLDTWLSRNATLRNYASGQGYADKVAAYDAFGKAVEERGRKLAKDPVGFVLSHKPDIAALIRSDSPAATRKGVEALVRAQQALGVASPRVLSDGAVNDVIGQFNNPQDPSKKAQSMQGIIGSLQERFGKYFPQAMSQLVKAGLPVEAYALTLVRDDPAASQRMALAINGGEDLKKLVPEKNRNDIDEEVRRRMRDFGATLTAQGDAAKTMARIQSAASIYAYQYVQEGVSPSEAARRASDDLILKHYTFQDTYRVPKGINVNGVSTGAKVTLANLTADQIKPPGTFDRTVPDAARVEASIRTLKAKGVWTTTDDEGGLQLMWPQEAGFVPARYADGRPIRKTWSELSAALPNGSSATVDAFRNTAPF